MPILTAAQIRAWDEYTIRSTPIASIDLMERASMACYEWLMEHGYSRKKFSIFCGKGNNGGDGLAIARLLSQSNHPVTVDILEFGHKGTEDFQINLARLHDTEVTIRFISTEDAINPIGPDAVVLDALLGSGLNRPLDGLTAAVVEHINRSPNTVISIDIPTGLYADSSSKGNTVVRAKHTLSLQCYKPAFLVAENEPYLGEVQILDIGLHPGFLHTIVPNFQWIDDTLVKGILKPRKKFAHKGDYGYAALVVGSAGMMGAATLSARACMRSGVGKLTCHIPSVGYTILQTAVPEAMSKVEPGDDHIQSVTGIEQYDAIGIGPGLGRHESHVALLAYIFTASKCPLVLDADALNTIGQHQELLRQLRPNTIITPHVKELERLFGVAGNDMERMQLAIQKAAEYRIIIVLKGAYTLVATPGGMAWFNSSGNPGMATGGSGDVLTGIITGLSAQGYTPEQAAIAGVYLHGLAGDLAAAYVSQESLIASDLIDHLGNAFHTVSND